MGGMIKCLKCLKVMHSLYRHDFQACNCNPDGAMVYVDGGHDYTRIGGHPENMEFIEHVHTHPEGKGGKDEVIYPDDMYASLM
jgi:hypothetical protein